MPLTGRRSGASARGGSSLVEVVVAIPLLALLGVVAVRLLLGVHQRALLDDGAFGATRELRHGAAVMFAELRGLRDRDVVAWSDSTIEFEATVGAGVICNVNPTGPWIATLGGAHGASSSIAPSFDANSGGTLDAVWNTPPQAGDRALWWERGQAPDDSITAHTSVVSSTAVSSDCSGSALLTAASSAATTRVALATAGITARSLGSPVRLVRRAKYSHYRSSDGNWYIGRRTFGVAGWDIVQPVAGPLESYARHGFHLAVLDSLGAVIAPGAGSSPRRIRLALAAPRRAGRANATRVVTDTLNIEIALRADREDHA